MKWTLIIVAALTVAACGEKAPKPKVQTTAMGAAPAPEVVDTRIATQIRRALLADRELGQYAIDVDSKEGLVVLGGVAPNPAAKERATEIARHTPDVKDVSNQLAVKRG